MTAAFNDFVDGHDKDRQAKVNTLVDELFPGNEFLDRATRNLLRTIIYTVFDSHMLVGMKPMKFTINWSTVIKVTNWFYQGDYDLSVIMQEFEENPHNVVRQLSYKYYEDNERCVKSDMMKLYVYDKLLETIDPDDKYVDDADKSLDETISEVMDESIDYIVNKVSELSDKLSAKIDKI